MSISIHLFEEIYGEKQNKVTQESNTWLQWKRVCTDKKYFLETKINVSKKNCVHFF